MGVQNRLYKKWLLILKSFEASIEFKDIVALIGDLELHHLMKYMPSYYK